MTHMPDTLQSARISKRDVMTAVVRLHADRHRPVDYIEVAQSMGANPSKVQDHLKNLRDDGELIHHPRKGYEPIKVAEVRPVTASQLEGGACKVEIGDECITLQTPAEILMLWDLLTPAGERHRNNQLIFNAVELVNQLSLKVQRLEKTIKALESARPTLCAQYTLSLPSGDEAGVGMER